MLGISPGRAGRAASTVALLLLVVLVAPGPAARAASSQDDVKAKIAEAVALLAKRATADALKILEPLATNPAVTADPSLATDVSYHTGNAYFIANEYPKALEQLERSRALSVGLADGAREARALFRIAQSHKNLGAYGVALERALETAALAERLKNPDQMARAFTVAGGIQDLMGRYPAALQSYQTAERLFAGAKTLPAIQLLNETAITYKNLGNFDAALALYGRALDGYRALGDRPNQAVALLNTGNVYALLGQIDRALDFFQQALAINRDLNERRGVSIGLNAVGTLLLSRGDTERALTLFKEQLELTLALGNRNEQGMAIQNLADAHAARGELDAAATRYDEALGIQRAIGAKVREANTLLSLAEVRLKQGNPAAAADLSGQALAIARESQAPDFEWRALHAGARAARAQSRPTEAIAQLRASTVIVNDLRANVSTDTLKIGFVDERQAVFHDLASLLVASGRQEEALEAAEAGRARAFADLLAQRQVEGKPAERVQLEAFRSTLSETRAAGPTPARAADGVRGGTLDTSLASLRAEHGELASLLTAESATTSEIKAIAGRLQATLVEYLVAERELLVWVVTPAGVVHATSVDVRGARLEGLVGEMRDLAAKVDAAAGTVPRRLTALARELDGILLKPIAQWLPASPDALVVVVPNGPLAVLPFAALVDARGRPLIARHTLAFAPAISVFRYTAEKRRAGMANLALVVADPTSPPEANLAALPGAREEGRLVAKRLAPANVTLLVGSAATESAFKRAAGNRRILHLATHGVISSDRPLASSLLLSPGEGEDGYLRVDEIFSLPLSADLVVLSGCSTGLGRPSGDGIIGLGRAFIYAGTPAVVVSQWDVSDRATAFLMDRFYASLGQGRGPAAALRAAQIATRVRYPHPAMWAAFVAIGEPR